MAITIPCKQCDNLVKLYPYDEKNGRKKYCSRKCKNEAQRGKHNSSGTEFKKGNRGYWYGKKRPEVKEWLTPFEKGHKSWNEGVKLPYSPRPNQRKVVGENNKAWKGDNVGYTALHDWVRRYLGKAIKCENNNEHKSNIYHWANKSGEYERDLNDWHSLCPSCNKIDGIPKHVRFIK